MDTFASQVGRRLFLAREAAGFTQARLAARLKISASRLSNWETGDHPVPPEFAPKIYAITKITADWLYLENPEGLPAHIRDKVIDKMESA